MNKGDMFKHVLKKGALPPAFLNNTMIHLLTTFVDSREKKPEQQKVKYEGPTSSWPCVIRGCRMPRHVEYGGKVRQRCTKHQREYNNERGKISRARKAERKNALPG